MTPTVASDIAADLQELVNLVFAGLTNDFKALIEDYTWKDQGKGKKAGETLVLRQTLFNDWDKDPNAAAFKMLTWGFNAWRAKKYLASDWLPSFVSTNNVRSTIEKFCHGTSASAAATWRFSSWTKVLAVRHPDQYFILDSRVCNGIDYYLVNSNKYSVRRCFPILSRAAAAEKKHRAKKLKEQLLQQQHAEIRIDGATLYLELYCRMLPLIADKIEKQLSTTKFALFENEPAITLSELKKRFTFNPVPHLIEMALFQKGDLAHD